MAKQKECTHQCNCGNYDTNNFRRRDSCCLKCPECGLNIKREFVQSHQIRCHPDTETTWRLFGYQA